MNVEKESTELVAKLMTQMMPIGLSEGQRSVVESALHLAYAGGAKDATSEMRRMFDRASPSESGGRTP